MGFRVFIALALMLRLGLFLYFIQYGQFVDNDSKLYLLLADNLLEHGVFSEQTTAPFTPEVFRTPGYPAFLALLKGLGLAGTHWVVFIQEIIYGLCIFMVYQHGQRLFSSKILTATLVFMLVEPGGLVYPKMIMSELLFLAFFLAGMLAIGEYLLAPRLRALFMAGVLLGVGALIRPAVFYLPVIISVVLWLSAEGNGWRKSQSGVFLLAFLLVVSPWLIRNYHYFGKPVMTGALSNLLVNYHAPIVMADAENISRQASGKIIAMQLALTKKLTENRLGRPLTVVEGFELEQQLGLAVLKQYPLTYLKQWVFGCLKTMNGPFVTQFYDSFGMHSERVHFAEAIQRGFLPGVIYYFKNLDLFFLLNTVLTMLMAVFALLGGVYIIQNKDPFQWIIMLSCFYFICIPGPEGYPRFRFPVGVFWFIQACIGYFWLQAKLMQRPVAPVHA